MSHLNTFHDDNNVRIYILHLLIAILTLPSSSAFPQPPNLRTPDHSRSSNSPSIPATIIAQEALFQDGGYLFHAVLDYHHSVQSVLHLLLESVYAPDIVQLSRITTPPLTTCHEHANQPNFLLPGHDEYHCTLQLKIE